MQNILKGNWKSFEVSFPSPPCSYSRFNKVLNVFSLANCQDKGGDSNPLWLVYMPSQTYTIFSEVPTSPEILPSSLEETEFDIPLMDTQCSLDSLPQEEPNAWCLQQPATPAAPSSAELKRRFDEYINPDFSNALDIDKSYVPQPRKRKAGRYTIYLFFL